MNDSLFPGQIFNLHTAKFLIDEEDISTFEKILNTTTKKINKVVISVKINTFDSKNSNRDAHMLEITEGIKYPTVTFVSSSIKEDGNTVDISGTINFHGVSKQIHFMGNESVINNKKIINGEFVVLLEDFKIERPSMMLMKTDNEMKMNFSVEYLMN